MKRDFGLTIAPGLAAALLLSGCGAPDRACVDPGGRRAADASCRSTAGGYHWYYGGNGRAAAYGERVSGGSYSNEGVSRGGFGESAHGARGG